MAITLEYEKAEELKSKFGGKVCLHNYPAKLTYNGTDAGYLLCSDCGIDMSEDYRQKLIENEISSRKLMDYLMK